MSLAVNPRQYRDPVRVFVETVLFEAGFSHLEPEALAELSTALTVEAHKRIGLDLMGALDKDSLAYFRSLRETDASEEEIAAFFRVRMPDLDARLQTSLSAFGVECLRLARQIGQKPAAL